MSAAPVPCVRRDRGFRSAALSLALLAACAAPARVSAAGLALGSDAEVTAAFIYNFVKFTEWPALPAGAPLIVCVVGDDKIAAALVDTVRGQNVDGRAVEIWRPLDASTWRACHVLFVGGGDVRRAAGQLEPFVTLPILTVSDGKGFSRMGGIIELYVEAARMRFAINIDIAQRAGLRLSSHLLGLATIVRDTHAR
jgi:hypothetical protein